VVLPGSKQSMASKAIVRFTYASFLKREV
jgi:hypothetical protein